MTQHVRVQCPQRAGAFALGVAVCCQHVPPRPSRGDGKKLISAKAGAEELSSRPFRGRQWRVSGPYHQHGLVADVLAPH